MANKEHLAVLSKGMAVWNNWRITDSSVAPDLSGASLSGLDLSKGDFRSADLSDADLSNANLLGADFTKANLSGVNFGGATGLTWQGFTDQ